MSSIQLVNELISDLEIRKEILDREIEHLKTLPIAISSVSDISYAKGRLYEVLRGLGTLYLKLVNLKAEGRD